MMIVRPMWVLEPGQPAAARVTTTWGSWGSIDPGKHYCSELAARAYGPRNRLKARLSLVIPPNELHDYGTIVFDSGAAAE